MKTDLHFLSNATQFFLEWEMFQTEAAEKIKTHILCSATFLFSESRVFCEVMWKKFVGPGRLQIIWSMRIAYLRLQTLTQNR